MKQATMEKVIKGITNMRTKVTHKSAQIASIEGWITAGETGFDEQGQFAGKRKEFKKLVEFARIQRKKDKEWLDNMDKFLTNYEF